MVLKQWVRVPSPTYLFENDVKMYGTQIVHSYIMSRTLFENDVKMYGTQTYRRISANLHFLRIK